MKQFQSPDEEDSEDKESAAEDIKWDHDLQLLFQIVYMTDSKTVLKAGYCSYGQAAACNSCM